ncbi:hypothetical protein MMC22_007479 [Lobaria immixta]|nr:hypothetical protein [Lobaria immixta]
MPASFLTIPAELRLRIYEYALISRCESIPNPSLMDGDKKMIMVDGRMNGKPTWSNTSISPALLQTCRTIYLEASPVMYAENTFFVQDPQNTIAFLQQIGSTQARDLESLKLWVGPGPSSPSGPSGPWVELLNQLAQNATGLRKLVIVFFANRTLLGPRWRDRGLGGNPHFLVALAKIQGLKTLEIGGYYAQHWLPYLEEKMGVSVHARVCFCETPSRADVENFIHYQRGVQHLNPWNQSALNPIIVIISGGVYNCYHLGGT